MRSWQMLPAFVALSAATCYLPDGREADEDWVPCNKADAFSFCCQDGDVCLDNGLCQAATGVQMGACQNSDWSGCHLEQQPATVTLDARQQVPATEIVRSHAAVGVVSTVVVIATQTRSVIYVTASETSGTTASATTQPTATASAEPKHDLNLALIIGCAAGGAVALAVVAGVICYCIRRRKKRRELRRRIEEDIRDTMSPDMMTPTLPVITDNWRRPIIMRDKKPVSTPAVAEIAGNPVTEVRGVRAEKKTDNAIEMDDGRRLDLPVEMDDGVRPIEIDDGSRLNLPVEMDAGRMHAGSHPPPWVQQRNMYEMG